MEINIRIKPNDEYKDIINTFDSLDEAIDYLKEWRAAVEATTQMDDAVKLMNF